MRLTDEITDLKANLAKLQKEQQLSIATSRQAEDRMRTTLRDNLALHQRLNQLEDEYANAKTDLIDLQSQIEYQHKIEEEKFYLLNQVKNLENIVTELKSRLAESQAEANLVQKIKDELSISDNKITELQEKLSLAESTIDTMKTSTNELEQLRLQLREKTIENRELNSAIRAFSRSENDLRAVQSRLEAAQQETSIYKSKVEQCAPMLAELARLRGASRAAVVSLQEQDKFILTLQNKNSSDDKIISDLEYRVKTYEDIENKLMDIEKENNKLQQIVHEEVPKLKNMYHQSQEEKKLLEIQFRQIKKNSRQTAITNTVSAAAAAFKSNIHSHQSESSLNENK
jgi:chromosome segregation ATPase